MTHESLINGCFSFSLLSPFLLLFLCESIFEILKCTLFISPQFVNRVLVSFLSRQSIGFNRLFEQIIGFTIDRIRSQIVLMIVHTSVPVVLEDVQTILHESSISLELVVSNIHVILVIEVSLLLDSFLLLNLFLSINYLILEIFHLLIFVSLGLLEVSFLQNYILVWFLIHELLFLLCLEPFMLQHLVSVISSYGISELLVMNFGHLFLLLHSVGLIQDVFVLCLLLLFGKISLNLFLLLLSPKLFVILVLTNFMQKL